MSPVEGRSLRRWVEDPGWRGRVGFISPPALSIDPMEFIRVAPEGFAVCQTMTHIPNFKVRSETIAQAVQQVEECALILKDAGVDIVAQSGTPFSFVVKGGLAFSRDLHARIEKATGIPFVMMGLAVVNAVKARGYKSVAVACTYYTDDMASKYTTFLQDAGIKVVAMENWLSQKLYDSQEEIDRAIIKRTPMSNTYKAARLAASHAPQAECIVISGGGVTTMDILDPLEQDLGKPVISSLAAQFWDILTRLGVREPVEGRGSLLASL